MKLRLFRYRMQQVGEKSRADYTPYILIVTRSFSISSSIIKRADTQTLMIYQWKQADGRGIGYCRYRMSLGVL